MRRLGVEHAVEGATDDGLFRVDCLLADGRTAVEADGWTPVWSSLLDARRGSTD